jgi:hypothetical protein
MNRIVSALISLGLLVGLASCSLSLLGKPIQMPTVILIPSPTPLLHTSTPVASLLLGPTPTMELPTITSIDPGTPTITIDGGPTPTTNGINSAESSGPYAVILVTAGDVLNIRSGPGSDYTIAGSFTSTAIDIMRIGPSTMAEDTLWVKVQNPGGGTGWVNSAFLTEYIAPVPFCVDFRVKTLITKIDTALTTSDGEMLASLVSPDHGMTVHLWRNGIAHTFKQVDAR